MVYDNKSKTPYIDNILIYNIIQEITSEVNNQICKKNVVRVTASTSMD